MDASAHGLRPDHGDRHCDRLCDRGDLPPLLTQLVTQVLVFFVMFFSPVTFSASQLPAWFRTVQDVLPFRPAADLIRAGLLSETYTASDRDLIALLVWCALALAISIRALVRRA